MEATKETDFLEEYGQLVANGRDFLVMQREGQLSAADFVVWRDEWIDIADDVRERWLKATKLCIQGEAGGYELKKPFITESVIKENGGDL